MLRVATVALVLGLFLPPSLIIVANGSSNEPATADKNHVSLSEDHAKILVGEVEDVLLVPWTIVLPARIDTGATVSALDARNLTIENNVADFTLGKKYGGLRLHLPIVKWLQVRTAVGTERRPVVEIGICLGSKLVHTLATLSDRSEMIYPFLVGRNVLNGTCMVDTSRSKAARPSCSQTLSRSDLN